MSDVGDKKARELRQESIRAAVLRLREKNPTEKERAMDALLKSVGLTRTSDR